ncbi:MAG: DUF2948 family protein [Hyphomonadaceae bacterium]
MSDVSPLRLIAEDAGDLQVIAAAVQDAVAKAGDLKYNSARRRFSFELNRYRWEASNTRDKTGERVRSLLAFDGVLSVKTRAITRRDPELIVSLLDMSFIADDEPPGGKLTLTFAGDGEIVLDVEVMDVTLLDSEYVWPTKKRPDHEARKR